MQEQYCFSLLPLLAALYGQLAIRRSSTLAASAVNLTRGLTRHCTGLPSAAGEFQR
jgi:hypothetical protein